MRPAAALTQRLGRDTVGSVVEVLETQVHREEAARDHDRWSAYKGLRAHDFTRQQPDTPSGCLPYQLDRQLIDIASDLIVQGKLALPELIRLWRGQTADDPRPNMALHNNHLAWLLHSYTQCDQVLDNVGGGVNHRFARSLQGGSRQTNHKSAQEMHIALCRSVAEGQAAGTYLVINLNVARSHLQLQYSPFGCVPKTDVDPCVEARVIHDLSYPHGASTNDWSDQVDLPQLSYVHVDVIAKRILKLRSLHPNGVIKLMKGYVKSAFRHVLVREDICAFFAGAIPEAGVAVIDLALPFGWTGSPAHYGVFGGAISYLVCRESPHSLNTCNDDMRPFFCFDWVDDHILVEVDGDSRLEACDIALSLAMVTVLGPQAFNKKKFTSW